MTGAELKERRKALGYSQRDLATLWEMGKNGHDTIRDWEEGRKPVPGPVGLLIRLMDRPSGPRKPTDAGTFIDGGKR